MAAEVGGASGPQSLGEAAAEWTESRWIDVAGSRVRYRDAGRGPPIVLVHGLGVSADYWVRNAAVIAAAGYRVLGLDLPGFGRSPGPEGGLDVHQQSEAVARWSQALGLGPAVYLGHSLSCQALLQMAVDHPRQVRGLILAAPTGEHSSHRRLFSQAVGLIRDLPREELKLAVFVAAAYLRAGPARVYRTWRRGARHDPLPLLPAVRAPALVVVGERDPVVDTDFAARVADGLDGPALQVVPHGSHAVIFDSTGEFNRIVLAFLHDLPAGIADSRVNEL